MHRTNVLSLVSKELLKFLSHYRPKEKVLSVFIVVSVLSCVFVFHQQALSGSMCPMFYIIPLNLQDVGNYLLKCKKKNLFPDSQKQVLFYLHKFTTKRGQHMHIQLLLMCPGILPEFLILQLSCSIPHASVFQISPMGRINSHPDSVLTLQKRTYKFGPHLQMSVV